MHETTVVVERAKGENRIKDKTLIKSVLRKDMTFNMLHHARSICDWHKSLAVSIVEIIKIERIEKVF